MATVRGVVGISLSQETMGECAFGQSRCWRVTEPAVVVETDMGSACVIIKISGFPTTGALWHFSAHCSQQSFLL